LFSGAFSEPTRPKAPDQAERLAWARRALLLSNLDTFTALEAREAVESMRPDLLGSGFWLGFVFQCEFFTILNHEKSTRPKAKGRWIRRWKLSDAGIRERRALQGGIHV
jgi:hypothetical protein